MAKKEKKETTLTLRCSCDTRALRFDEIIHLAEELNNGEY